MNLHSCFNVSEDRFPLPERIRSFYGPFGFPEPPADRPHIVSNFVMALDGRASFREIKNHAGGKDVSHSKEDRWLMDFLRAHHDAVIMGANTMREEPGPDSKGWDYAIDDEELSAYRRDVLKLGPLKVIILSLCETIDFSMKLFNSTRVEPMVLTSSGGAKCALSQMAPQRPMREVKVIRAGEGAQADLPLAMQILRREHGIRNLLCEGGPTVYAEFLKQGLIDEDFRTVAFQVLGRSTNPEVERPTPYANLSFTPETAPWFRLISLHYSPPYHAFLRLRFEGPRQFTR
jgi:riboflavin biosynthesis pyrimidine reductase